MKDAAIVLGSSFLFVLLYANIYAFCLTQKVNKIRKKT